MPPVTLYAEVAFKRGGKKTFSYLIPDALRDQVVQIGRAHV